ncbi:hemicentin-1 isoform X2 [Ixodes scapularis]|uniref:hemicentin-1 isoform X2 n=1 Tax=Ixodes scapularis TaxID=6945 RepID=UPI001A9FCDF8|nr:hemicentin-1 isoform X2 [Ixodes scapularis]
MRTLTVCVFLVALSLPNSTSSNEEVKSKSVQKFLEEPEDTEVNPGEDVTLRCVVENRRGNCAWLMDGVAVGRIPDKYVYERSPKNGDCSLQILNTTLEEDNGSWQCQVTQASLDEKPLASTNIKLVVLESPHPPSIQNGSRLLTPSSNFTTKAGDSLNFQCVSGKGNPPAFLRWFLDSQDVSHLATQTNETDKEKPYTWKALSVLNYTFNNTDNGKQLKCGAYHVTYGKVVEDPEARGLGHRDVAVALNVKYLPEIKYDGNPPEEVAEGDSLKLSCAVTDANPPASVAWRKTGQSSIYAKGSSLEFTSIRRTNSSVYSCFAENDVGKSPEIPVRVDVKFPAKIIRVEPPTTTFTLNEDITLHCYAEGNPAPEITWLKQNEEDPEKWDIQSQNRTLTIENASYSNSGVYRCDARNMIRTKQHMAKSREIRLAIKGKPTLRTNIEWKRNTDGSHSAELVCTVDSVTRSHTKWLGNDGSPLLQGASIQLSVVGNDHRAKINNASELNYGNYTCVSKNKYGIANSTVEISGKPTLKTTMQWTRVVDGNRMVELVCEVFGANASRTDWLRSDGYPLVHSEFVHLFVDGNKHTAQLNIVSSLDYGNYTCVSENKYGIATSAVQVSGEPTLRTTVHWTRNLDGTRDAELVCTVYSVNPSRTKWLGNDGSPLRPDEYLQLSVDKNNHRVQLNNASELNYGNYTCISQNKYGTAMSTVEMSGKPTLRTNIEWTRNTDGSRSAELVCTVDSVTQSRTKWLGNDGSLLLQGESIRFSVVGNDHRAKINNASELNYGNYTCVSENKYGIVNSTVEISGKPTLETTVQWARGVDGSRMVELVCEVLSANARRTDWLRSDGSPLVQGEFVHLFLDGNKHTAKLKNLGQLSYDNYTCVSQNKYGIAKSTVEISGKPTLRTTVHWTHNLDGSRDAELVCTVDSVTPSRTKWLGNDGSPLRSDEYLQLSVDKNNHRVKFNNASELNYGNYTCVAKNNYGIAMSTVEMSGKPTLRTNIEWTRNTDGSHSAELVCTVDSVTQSRTEWLGNDGSRLLQGASIQLSVVGNDHRAKITNASELNYGNYTCVSQNKYGIATSTVDIPGKPTLKTTMHWTRGADGSGMVELLCEVLSAHARRTVWLRSDRSPLVHGEFVHLSVDGNKHMARLKNVSELEYDNYTCVSENKYGIAMSTVEISGKPSLRTTIHWTRNLDGSRDAELVCAVDSVTPSRTKWLGNDGSPLLPDEYLHFSVVGNDHWVKFNNASGLNYGYYTCVSHNKYGIAMSTVEMSGKPILKTNIEWTRHSDGSRSAELVCTVDSANPSHTAWLHNDGTPLLQGESINLFVVGSEHRAKINNASEQNYGNYTCASQNKYGIAMSTVEFSGKPTVETTLRWTRGFHGRPIAELLCTVDSAHPSHTDWLRSGLSPQVPGESLRLAVAGNNHTVKFHNVKERDYGNYTCVSKNKYGIAMSTVEISGKPTVNTTLQWTRKCDGNMSAELVCVVFSPGLTFTHWQRDDGTLLFHGESVHLSSVGYNTTAKFNNVSERDYGNYTCVSKNKYGIAMGTVEISDKSAETQDLHPTFPTSTEDSEMTNELTLLPGDYHTTKEKTEKASRNSSTARTP